VLLLLFFPEGEAEGVAWEARGSYEGELGSYEL
jgi:hypothetical protein